MGKMKTNSEYVLQIFFLLTDSSNVERACQMKNNPPSCRHQHSSDDGDCQVKVYHSNLDSDDYFENPNAVSLFISLTRED